MSTRSEQKLNFTISERAFIRNVRTMQSAYSSFARSMVNDTRSASNALRNFSFSLAAVPGLLSAATAGATAFGVSYTRQLQRARAFTNLAVQDLQELEGLFGTAGIGGGLEATGEVFREFGNRIAETARFGTGEAQEALQVLGRNANRIFNDFNRDAAATVHELVDEIQLLDRATQVLVAEQLFGDTGSKLVQLIGALSATRREALDVQNALRRTISETESDEILQLGDQFTFLRTNLDDFSRELAAVYAPAFTGIVQSINRFVARIDITSILNNINRAVNFLFLGFQNIWYWFRDRTLPIQRALNNILGSIRGVQIALDSFGEVLDSPVQGPNLLQRLFQSILSAFDAFRRSPIVQSIIKLFDDEFDATIDTITSSLIPALQAFYNAWSGFFEAISAEEGESNEAFRFIGNIIKALANFVGAFVRGLIETASILISAGGGLVTALRFIGNIPGLRQLLQFFNALIEAWIELPDIFKQIVADILLAIAFPPSLVATIARRAGPLLLRIRTIFEPLIGFLNTLVRILAPIGRVVASAFRGLVRVIDAAIERLARIFNFEDILISIRLFIALFPRIIARGLARAAFQFADLAARIRTFSDNLIQPLRGIGRFFADVFDEMADTVFNAAARIRGPLSAIIELITVSARVGFAIFRVTIERFASSFGGLAEVLREPVEFFKGIIEAINTFIDAIFNAEQAVASTDFQVLTAGVGGLGNLADVFRTIIRVLGDFIGWITRINPVETLRNFADGLRGALQRLDISRAVRLLRNSAFLLGAVALVRGLIDTLSRGLDRFLSFLEFLARVATGVVGFIVGIKDTILGLLGDVIDQVVMIAQSIRDSDLAMFLSEVLTTAIGLLETAWTTAWNAIRDTATGVWDALSTAASTAFDWLTNPESGLRRALSSLGTLWSNTWNGIKTAAMTAWGAIKSLFFSLFGWLVGSEDGEPGLAQKAWDVVKTAWGIAWNAIKTAAMIAWNALKAVFFAAFGWLVGSEDGTRKGLLQLAWEVIKTAWGISWEAIKTAAMLAWDALRAVFFTAFGWLVGTEDGTPGLLQLAWDVIKTAWGVAWMAISTAAKMAWDALRGVFFTAFEWLVGSEDGETKGVVIGAWDAIKNTWNLAWMAIKMAAMTAWNGFRDLFFGAFGWLVEDDGDDGVFIKAIRIARRAWQLLTGAIKTIVTTAWNGIRTAFFTAFGWLVGDDQQEGLFKRALDLVKTTWNTVWAFIDGYREGIWTTLKNAFFTLFGWLVGSEDGTQEGLFSKVLNAVKILWGSVWSAIKGFIQTVWMPIKTGFFKFFRWLVGSEDGETEGVFIKALNIVRSVWETIWDTGTKSIRAVASKVWSAIRSSFLTIFKWLVGTDDDPRSAIERALDGLRAAWSFLWDHPETGIRAIGERVWNTIKDKFYELMAWLIGGSTDGRSVIEIALNALKIVWDTVWMGLWTFFRDTFLNPIDSAVKGFITRIQNAVKRLRELLNEAKRLLGLAATTDPTPGAGGPVRGLGISLNADSVLLNPRRFVMNDLMSRGSESPTINVTINGNVDDNNIERITRELGFAVRQGVLRADIV